MAALTRIFSPFIAALPTGAIDLIGTPLRVALLTSAFTPTFNETTWDDVFEYECESQMLNGGYNSYGLVLANKTWSTADAKVTRLMCDPPNWPAMTATFRYAVAFVDDATRPLIGVIDYGADQTYTEASFTVDLTSGLLTLNGA